MGENWVFGYGSLMWRPGFSFVEQRPARLHGYHRALCVYSWVHRGTQDNPGLVLGLDRGGSCRGICFRVADEDWEETVAYLRAREQVTGVYLEKTLQARCEADGGVMNALCYVVDRAHEQYTGVLDPAAQAAIVARAQGQSGHNRDYVLNTLAHMDEASIRDDRLKQIGRMLGDAAES